MPIYSLNKLISDLKCDFRRYYSYCGYHSKITLWRFIRVLLKNPIIFSIVVHRYGFWVNTKFNKNGFTFLHYVFGIFYYIAVYLSAVLFKVEIEGTSIIGPGLFLSNKGYIIIGVNKMGENCAVSDRVTIGLGKENIPPEIGNNVQIGSGSIVYGKIKIGNDVSIHESTVLSRNISDNCQVSGNPARIYNKLIS